MPEHFLRVVEMFGSDVRAVVDNNVKPCNYTICLVQLVFTWSLIGALINM